MYGPIWSFLLMCVSRDTRRKDFPRVDGLSTDTPVLGRHTISSLSLFFFKKRLWIFPHIEWEVLVGLKV